MMCLGVTLASIISVFFFTGQLTVAQLAPATPGVVTVPSTTPMSVPPPATPPPSSPASPGTTGQMWCVAVVVGVVTQAQLQTALDYACGHGADCAPIQPAGICFSPNTLQNHSSFAFNSYYQKNPKPTSCNFNGAATITTTDPSYNNCIYPSSSSSTALLRPPTPATTTTTQFPPPPPPYLPGLVTPPTILNSSYPPLGSFGGSPFTDSSSASMFTGLQKPFVRCIALLVGVAVFDI